MKRRRRRNDRNAERSFWGHSQQQSGVSAVYCSKCHLVGVNSQAQKVLSTGVAKAVKRNAKVHVDKAVDHLQELQTIDSLKNVIIDKVSYVCCKDISGELGKSYKLRVRCNGTWFTVRELIKAQLLSRRDWHCCAEPISREMCQMGVCKLLEHFNLPISEGVRAAGILAAFRMGVSPVMKKKVENTTPLASDVFVRRMSKARAQKRKSIPKILKGDVSFDEFVKNVPKRNGHKYEATLLRFLRALGLNVRRLPKVSDHGVDIIVRTAKRKVAIQCKFYGEAPVGNIAVQQTFAGMHFYDCDTGWIVTNSRYTASAVIEAKKLGIRLLNHDTFPEELNKNFGLLTPTGRMKKRKDGS